jgi:diguanylate cyclase (GGDEF)-like protein
VGNLAIEAELQRRALISARATLLAAPIGVAMILAMLGRTGQPAEMVWAVLASVLGVTVAAISHLQLKQRLNFSTAALRAWFVGNAVVSLSFVPIFHPKLVSRPAMFETLVATVVCLSQIVTFSANRLVSTLILIYACLVIIFGSAIFRDLPLVSRLGLVVPSALVFLVILEILHRQQRDVIALSLENRRLIDDLKAANSTLEAEVSTDALTGLTNRAGLYQAFEIERLVGLLYVDVDRFKLVNDSLGHAEGDRVLCVIGEALRQATRPGDVVARLGGDEFIVLLEGANDIATIEVGNRICAQVRQSLNDDSITVSVGATSGLMSALSADLVLAKADAGLYRAKQAGGDRVECLQ